MKFLRKRKKSLVVIAFIWTVITATNLSGACTPDAAGICVSGLTSIQNNLIGPLIPYGASPWFFGDLAESGVAQNMAVNALIETPTLGTACPGTASWTSGSNIVTTTASMVACLAGKTYVVLAWDSVDGAGTGRAQCPIASVTATTITCQENLFEPTSSGVTAYNMPGPGPSGFDFLGWTAESPSVSWNYYDVAIGLYRLYYRTLNATYQTQARAYADITWQWTLDHGYRFVTPRAASMISQFFRAGEGHTERLPGLYGWISHLATAWVPTFCPYCDNREVGYMTWDEALGAKVDTDPTRHAQYCSWLSTYVPQWNSVQSADGSFGENEYALNSTFVSAPKTFSAPFLYQGAPWRVAIPIKALEAAYESLNDVSSQGCNSPTLATATLGTITNAVIWQRNYGRDSVNRGVYYEVNSQSDDQDSVFPGGTVSVNLTSTSVLGVGTNWNTAGFCDGTHFIGIAGPNDPRTVYKIASCADNTHATLSVAFGLYGETLNVSAQQYGIAPAAFTSCHSSATYCFGSAGDRNLTRTVCDDTGWLYAKTFNLTYKNWTDECLSAQLGGPTAGLTSAANEGASTLPCSGAACDGLVTDTWEAAKNCGQTVPINTAPCLYGNVPLSNLGKNFGEAFGAGSIDNALARRLLTPSGPPVTTVTTVSGAIIIP